jgi:flagellar basal-body rod protein FlgF
MSSGLYVAISGQVALERRLASIANNVANANTAGFRAEEIKFDSIFAAAAGSNGSVAYVSPGDIFISRKAGPVNHTGNPLDVAVQGDAWLAIATPDGTAYTRDGRMHMAASGELQSAEGYSVLDPGGSPILIDSSAGDVRIGDDGTITQNGKPIGALGLFSIAENSRLERGRNASVIPSQPAQPVEDLTNNGVRQGYLEGANVNPVVEMSRLIEVTRAFDNACQAMTQTETAQQDAIHLLSSTG